MQPPLITAERIRQVVRLDELIEPTVSAFTASSAGLADNGLIIMVPGAHRTDGDVYVKTATIRGCPIYLVKTSPWFAANRDRGLPQGGFVAVFDSATGHTLAILEDEHVLSDLRTAAAGTVIARLLAPPDTATALVVGSGTQAFLQPQALHRAREFQTLLIWARATERADALGRRLRIELPEVDVRVVADLQAAVSRADVILTTTAAREPLIQGRWLRPGQHITAVGADDESKSELDAEALRRSRVFVDARATAVATGEVHRAIAEGAYSAADIAGELGDALSGDVPGRTGVDDITIATVAGLGAQDLVTAEVALRALGIDVPEAS